MKTRFLNFFRTYPLFVWLLPIFFVFHGYIEQYNLVTLKDALELILIYLVSTFILLFIFNLFYKENNKSSLLVFVILSYNFFFGSAHTFLKNQLGDAFILKYSFILPCSLGLFILLIIYLKKTKKRFTSIIRYFNFLFVLLIIVDIFTLASKISNEKKPLPISSPYYLPCDSCQKPDIYLIIADEYAGKTQLKEMFSFDNSNFENNLIQRGFHIFNNTTSNYNWTLYSMASIFNMNYLPGLKDTIINTTDKFYCSELIKNNEVGAFFKKSGYDIYNYSFFDFAGLTKPITPVFLPEKKTLITAQTFTSRVTNDLWFNFVSTKFINNVLNRNLYNNIKVDSLSKASVLIKSNKPRFVYTHLTLPHYSYYFDSSGNKRKPQELTDENKLNKQAYIEYLVYSNKKLLELIDFIKFNSATPPIILLMSDHGFRQYNPLDKLNRQLQFYNLNAILFPNGNYAGFYDGMSSVNQFRALLNSQFHQEIPLLSDSTIFLKEPY